MAAYELGVAYVSLVVSTKGVGGDVRRALGDLPAEGDKAGREIGRRLSDSATKSTDLSGVTRKVAQAQDTAAKSSADLSRAQQRQQNTSANLAIAEQKLVETQGRYAAGSSQVMAAEQRVTRARQASTAAQHQAGFAAATATQSQSKLAVAANALAQSQMLQAASVGQLDRAQIKATSQTQQWGTAQAGAATSSSALAAAQAKLGPAFANDAALKTKSAAATQQLTAAVGDAPSKVGGMSAALSRAGIELGQTATQSERARTSLSGLGGGAVVGGIRNLGAELKSSLGIGVGAGIVATIGSAVKLEATFSQTMMQVKAAAQVPTEQMQRLNELAIQLGADTSFSAGEAASAMLELSKAGLSPATIEAGALAATLTQAEASGDGLAESANAIGNALNMFSLEGSEAASVAAAFAGGANASTAEVRDLTLGLAQVGPGAAAAGMSIQEVVGTLSAFNNAGMSGSDAGTSLKTMLTSLVPSSETAARAMESLGLYTADSGKQLEFLAENGIKAKNSNESIHNGFMQLALSAAGAGASTAEVSAAYSELVRESGATSNAFFTSNGEMKSATEIAHLLQEATKGLSDEERTYALNKIFGSDASRAANILAREGAAGLTKYIDATKNASAAQEMANARMEGTAGALERLSGGWETFRLQIGEALSPVIQGAAIALGAVLDKMGGSMGVLVPLVTALVGAWATYTATVKLAAAATMLQEMWTARAAIAQMLMNRAVMLNPLGLVVTAIVAVVAALVLLYQNSETVRNVVTAAWEGIKTAAVAAWEVLSAVFSAIGEAIGGAWSAAWAWLSTTAAAAWEGIKTAASTAWDWVVTSVFGPMREFVTVTIPGWWAVFTGALSAAWQAVTSAASAAWEFLNAYVFAPLKLALDVIVIAFGTFGLLIVRAWAAAFDLVKQNWDESYSLVFEPIVQWFRDTIPPILDAFVAFWAGVWESVKVTLSAAWAWIVDNVFTPMSTFITVTVPSWWQSFTDALTAIWEAIKAMLAASWQWIVDNVFGPMANFVEGTLKPLWESFKQFLSDTWEAIKAAFAAAWAWIVDNVFGPMANFVEGTLKPLWESFKQFLSDTWDAIGRAIDSAVTWIRDNVFAKFMDAVDSVWDFVGKATEAIAGLWEGLKEKMAGPARWIVDKAINPIIDAWNTVADKVNADLKINKITVGFRHGGYTGPGGEWAPAGVVHRGEYVLRREATAKLRRRYGLDWLDRLNQTGDPEERPGPRMGGPRTSPITGTRPADQGVWQQMAGWLKSNVPGAVITSAYRPTMTATGNVSNHARGLAVDIAGGGGVSMMSVFNAIRSAFGSSSLELIHSQAGANQIYRGKPHYYSGVTRANHFDHVHWAMPGMPDGEGGFLGNIGNFIGGIWDAAVTKLWGLFDTVKGVTGQAGAVPGYGKLMLGMLTNWVDMLRDWGSEKFASLMNLFGFADGTDPASPVAAGSGNTQAAVRGVASQYGWGSGAQWDALSWIIGRESSWNTTAQNPTSTAYGLFQFLNSTWGTVGARKTSDPAGQAAAGMAYIRQRYGTPVAAQAFWRQNNWYRDGGLVEPTLFDAGGFLNPGIHLVENATGKPETIRTWEQEQALRQGLAGAPITINGIRHDSVPEFAAALNWALSRAETRSRYAGVGVGA